MTSVFLDTGYVIALEAADDQYHEAAVQHWRGFTTQLPPPPTLSCGIRWTAEAQRWPEDIFEYIAADNPRAAAQTVNGIYERARVLSGHA